MVDKPQDEFIEFHGINKDPFLTNIVRKIFRIPISLQGNIFFIIGGKNYSVIDINNFGIGISIKTDTVFKVGQILANCEITFGDKPIKRLEGEIIHCSPYREDSWLYGIKWLNLDGDAAEKINQVLLTLKKELFKKENLETDITTEL